MGATSFKLNLDDAKRLGWHALMIGGGAAIVYLLKTVGLPIGDPVLATAVTAWLVNVINKYVSDNTK
jgi:hypothetical protein